MECSLGVNLCKTSCNERVSRWNTLECMFYLRLKVCLPTNSEVTCTGDIIKLVKRVRRYFEPSVAAKAMEEFEKVAAKFTRLDMKIHRAAVLLSLFFPRHVPPESVVGLLHRFIDVWGWVERNSDWDLVWSSLIKRVIRHNYVALLAHGESFAPKLFTNAMAMVSGAVYSVPYLVTNRLK